MGYYTHFELSVFEGTVDLDAVNKVISRIINDDDEYEAFENLGGVLVCNDDMKWYDHDEDTAEMSKKFPGVVFCLDGKGEESGDIWRCYYKDGKIQICRAVISFSEYDPKKLTSVEVAQSNDQGRNGY